MPKVLKRKPWQTLSAAVCEINPPGDEESRVSEHYFRYYLIRFEC